MADPLLRDHIANLLAESNFEWQISEGRLHEGDPLDVWQADALLDDPPLAAIIDLAAWFALPARTDDGSWRNAPEVTPEVRALLADWRAER